MSRAQVVSVGAAHLAGAEDSAGRLVAGALQAEGAAVGSRTLVDEDEGALESALRAALGAADLVVVLAVPGGSGGEIVRRVLARLAETRLVLHERLLELLEQDFVQRGQAMPRRLDRLALLPQGAQLWPAPSGEPAWTLAVADATVVVLPAGSPHLSALAQDQLRPLARLAGRPGEIVLSRTLRAIGLAPAEAEERLGPWLGAAAGPVAVTCQLEEGEVWVRITSRGASRALAEATLDETDARVAAALGADCYGRDGDSLEVVVGRLLLERGLMMATAESCTGGLVASRLTDIAGSSRYFERGLVVYSNSAKQELLGVPEAVLRAHGAVSAPTAEAMVRGLLRAARVPCGVAITGIAGPDGGTPEKPVGTVFIAAAAPSGVTVRRCRFAGTRESIKAQSARAALDLLRRALLA